MYCEERFKATISDVPGSKPDQRYAQRRDRQNYIRKIKYKFRTNNSKLVQYTGTLGECGPQGC